VSWIDRSFPTTATPSDLVGRVLGLNPGMMTGPGTNTYLVGRRDPILIDTGAGIAEYAPLLSRYLGERGWSQPSRVRRSIRWNQKVIHAPKSEMIPATALCLSKTAPYAAMRKAVATRKKLKLCSR